MPLEKKPAGVVQPPALGAKGAKNDGGHGCLEASSYPFQDADEEGDFRPKRPIYGCGISARDDLQCLLAKVLALRPPGKRGVLA